MEAARQLLCLVISMGVLGAAVGARPPAMYVFGDSTLDVGNNNYLAGAGVSRANRPYYGIDFPLRIPTGSKEHGIREQPSGLPVAGTNPQPSCCHRSQQWCQLCNAGISIPLRKQVEYFSRTKARMVATLGSGSAVNALLARSVFLIGVGSNDLFAFAAAEQAQNRSAAEDVADFFTSLISNYSAAITELHAMGARRFAIINVGLLGCVPTVRVLDPAAGGACADGLNQLAAGFDGVLEASLAAGKLPGLVYSLADSYGLTVATFADPQASGYTDIAGACCGSGRLNAETDCVPNATLCANRDQLVFWDRYHPSQRAAFLTAQAFYNGPAQYTKPINFMQLAAQTS
ncbi:hypothetical protein EJB05_09803, partial [Eragrostis curvula]